MSKHRLNSKSVVGVSILVLMALVLMGARVEAGSDYKLPRPTGEKPLWSVDLQSQGFARHGLGFYWFASHRYTVSTFDVRAVALNSKGQGAVVFTTKQEQNGGGDVPGTGVVHFICFDTVTGKFNATTQWPTKVGFPPSAAPTIRATPRGNFLFKDDDRLVLYSPALKAITSLEVGDGRYLPHHFWVSSDGHYAFLESQHDKMYTLSMLDSETLQTIQSWTLEQSFAAASEHFLAIWQEPQSPSRGSLYLRSEHEEWKEVYGDGGCNNLHQSANFLTESVLLIASCNKLTVLNVEGKRFFSHTFLPTTPLDILYGGFSGDYLASPARPAEMSFSPSSDGRRFAIVVDKIKKDPWWTGDPGEGPVPWRLVINDTESAEAISSFAVNIKYPNSDWSIGFALSPDGSELALCRDGVLELFRLPASSPSP